MKTDVEIKFDELIKQSLSEILKKYRFKRKGNNFYLFNGQIGKIINIQKSAYGNRREISFTMNVSIFSPDFWDVFYNYDNSTIPLFPTEPVCVVRNRIGYLLGKNDKWFEMNQETDLEESVKEMKIILCDCILPYFGNINTNEDLILELDTNKNNLVSFLAKMIILARIGRTTEAIVEMDNILKKVDGSKFKEQIVQTAKQLGIL